MSTALLFVLASGVSIPSGGMDVVNHLLKRMPAISRTDRSGAADVGLWITPEGRIASCEITRSTGNAAVVGMICPSLEDFVFASPVATDGSKAYAHTTFTLVMFPDQNPGYRRTLMKRLRELRADSDEARLANSLRPDARKPFDLRLALEVDESGLVTHCERESDKTAQELADLACPKLMGASLPRRSGEQGEPVRYVMRFGFDPS